MTSLEKKLPCRALIMSIQSPRQVGIQVGACLGICITKRAYSLNVDQRDVNVFIEVKLPGIFCSWASLMAQSVKNPPAMRETQLRSLGWEDSLEKGKTTHSSILAWRIPWTAWSVESQGVGHD